jgi:hypothetical protein
MVMMNNDESIQIITECFDKVKSEIENHESFPDVSLQKLFTDIL